MDQNRPRPLAFVVGRDDRGWADPQAGLDWLLSREDELLILVPQQSHFRPHRGLGDVIGHDAAERLGQGRTSLGDPPRTVYGATWRSFPPGGWSDGPVLALWPDAKVLGRLDESAPRVTAICVVPWSDADEVEVWARARGAVDVTRPEADLPAPPTIRDPVVQAAMRSVSLTVNLRSGLLDPRDRSRAIEVFRTLQRGGHRWEPGEVKTWALANGWDMDGAERLREFGAGVQQGKRYRTDRMYALRPEALERWREEAEAERNRDR